MTHSRQDLSASVAVGGGGDPLGRAAAVAAVVSLLGFVVLVVGHLVDPAGFNNGKHSSAGNNVAFFAFVVGLLIALFLGGVTSYAGRRSGRPRSAEAVWATYYALTFLVVAIVAAALGA